MLYNENDCGTSIYLCTAFGSLCLLLSFFLFSCSLSLSAYLFCWFSLPATPLPFQHIPYFLSLSTGASLSCLRFPEPAVPSDRDQAGYQRGNVISSVGLGCSSVYRGPLGNQRGNVTDQLVRLHFRLIEIQLAIKEVMLDIS